MSTPWTIRSRRNAASVCRHASLISLPDLSDHLEIGSRPSSGASGLFESWGQTSNDSNNYQSHSNISVSFLGSRIRRQYRSAFLLADERVVGVSRCETFHPEDAKVDVRVDLSLQGPPDEPFIPGHRRSQSVPSLIRDSLDENHGWARLMLTIDRPRDSELLGRIGSRNYFSKGRVNAPYFHRRITPMRKEEEYIIGVSTFHEAADPEENFDNVSTTLLHETALDRQPSIDRVEKETCFDAARCQGSPISVVTSTAISLSPRLSLSEKEESHSQIPETRTPSTNLHSSENLPSTERSESIIHLKRSKSESSICKPAIASLESPWDEPLCLKGSAKLSSRLGPESPSREASAPLVDNTLSSQTGFEEDDEAPKAEGSRTGWSPVAISKVQNSEESAIVPSGLSFVSVTNGIVVQLGVPNSQECISSYYGRSPMKKTTLYTTLQTNGIVVNLDSDDSIKTPVSNEVEETNEGVKLEGSEFMVWKIGENIELDSPVPTPRERKRCCGEVEELPDDASQTDYSQKNSSTLTQSLEQDPYVGASVQSIEAATRLPPRSVRRFTQGDSPSMSPTSDNRISTGNRSSPKVTPRRQGKGAKEIPDGDELASFIQPENVSSHVNLFRSPFDPRSEDLLYSRDKDLEDLASSTGKHRHRQSEWSESGSGAKILFDEAKPIIESGQHSRSHGDTQNAYDGEEENLRPRPVPRRQRDNKRRSSSEDRGMNALEEYDEEDDDLEDSWVDEESQLRPPALPINLESALAELPVEDPATRTKRLRPLQYPLYVNVGDDHDDAIYDRNRTYNDTRPLRTMDQNIPGEELPNTLVIRTRRRTMSGVTGFLPRTSTLSSSSIWFGDHPVPTKAQIYAADHSPLRLSSIQLQAQAEIARRRSRNSLAARSMLSGAGLGRSRSLERSRATLGASTSALYGPTGRRVHGGAPLVERAIKRHMSHRDGYETLSLVHVPRLEGDESSSKIATAVAEQRQMRRPASSASVYKYRAGNFPSQINATRNRNEARSLIAQAAVDLAVHTFDPSEI